MQHHRRVVSAAFVTAALMAGIAACGTPSGPGTKTSTTRANAVSATPAATRDPLAGLSASRIVAEALADVKAATSVHISGGFIGSGKTQYLNLNVARGKGCRGSMARTGEGSFQIVFITGQHVWIKPDQTFYDEDGTDGAKAWTLLKGKWLGFKPGSSGLGGLSSSCELDNLTSGLGGAVTGVTRSTATVDGQRVVKLANRTNPAQYVAISDSAHPELAAIADAGSGTIRFGGYNAPVKLTAPPAGDVVEGSEFGF